MKFEQLENRNLLAIVLDNGTLAIAGERCSLTDLQDDIAVTAINGGTAAEIIPAAAVDRVIMACDTRADVRILDDAYFDLTIEMNGDSRHQLYINDGDSSGRLHGSLVIDHDNADVSTLIGSLRVYGDVTYTSGYNTGDVNRDGVVDSDDLNTLGMHWNVPGQWTWADGDVTGDGNVDADDLNVIGMHWRQSVREIAKDTIWAQGLRVEGTLSIESYATQSFGIEMIGGAGAVRVRTSTGNDLVDIYGLTEGTEEIDIHTGEGDDTVKLMHMYGRIRIDAGAGYDRLTSKFCDLTDAVFAGVDEFNGKCWN